MQPSYYFYLFLAKITENDVEKFRQYALGDGKDNPLFFSELQITDFSLQNYGIEVLSPDFQYDFPLSELLKLTLLQKEDLPLVEKICAEKGISPNVYIILYKKDLQLPENVLLSHPDLHYVGNYKMDANAMISKQLLYPQLF